MMKFKVLVVLIAQYDKILVILSLWRSIHKFKVWIFRLFLQKAQNDKFYKNLRYILNSLDFSFVSLTQNDKFLVILNTAKYP